MKRVFIIVGLLGSLLTGGVSATDRPGETVLAFNSDEELALFNIMNILDLETEIATKRKTNADYVPGIVTVLQGDHLEALGATDVHSALRYVPGANLVANNYGRKGVTVRGIGGAFGSSNLKLMLNGHAVNGNFAVAAPHLMNLPIEQVARIEVIRGPGSILYGEYAFSGVINVVTRVQQSRATVGFGSFGEVQLGGVAHEQLAEGVELSLNLSARSSDGERQPSGVDRTGVVSGELNTSRQFGNLFAALKLDQTLLEAHYMSNGKGDHFGISDLWSGVNDDVVVTDTLLKVDLTQPFTLSDQLEMELQLDYSRGGFHMDEIRVLGTSPVIVSVAQMPIWSGSGVVSKRTGCYGGCTMPMSR